MTDPRALATELEKDLLRAAATRKVVYLEGPTDVLVFFALVGRDPPPSVPPEGLPLDGIWIRGLTGSHAVRQRVDAAAKHPQFAGIRGFIDGDGRDLAELGRSFAGGPLHTWKAYCIENLLAQVCWPPEWGPEPDWSDLLAKYLPYAALNRVVAELRDLWSNLGLVRFDVPALGQPLRTSAEIHARLCQPDVTTAMTLDVAGMYARETERCEAALRSSLNEAHALIDGKWLVEVHAVDAARRSPAPVRNPKDCREHWARVVAKHGGHPEVVEFWRTYCRG